MGASGAEGPSSALASGSGVALHTHSSARAHTQPCTTPQCERQKDIRTKEERNRGELLRHERKLVSFSPESAAAMLSSDALPGKVEAAASSQQGVGGVE